MAQGEPGTVPGESTCPSCQKPTDAQAIDCPSCGEALLLQQRFRLTRFIGQGGQGRTYQGIDQENGEVVAVKELSVAQARDWKAVELFRRSAEVLAQLDHDGMPRMIAHFEIERDGISFFYVVQEFIEGRSLQQALDAGERFDTPDALQDVAEQLLTILIYLHSRQPPIIHRDIKPANIMQRPDGQLALIDFGLVRDESVRGGGSTMMMGTPGYAPLEQFMGRAEPATDIYAFGATLIALASGKDPDSLLSRTTATLEFREELELPFPMLDLLEDMVQPDINLRIKDAETALARLKLSARRPERNLVVVEKTQDFLSRLMLLPAKSREKMKDGFVIDRVRRQQDMRSLKGFWSMWFVAFLYAHLQFLGILVEGGAAAIAGFYGFFGGVGVIWLIYALAIFRKRTLGPMEVMRGIDKKLYFGPANIPLNNIPRWRVSLKTWRVETYYYNFFGDGQHPGFDACVIMHLKPRHAEHAERLRKRGAASEQERTMTDQDDPYLRLSDKKMLRALRSSLAHNLSRQEIERRISPLAGRFEVEEPPSLLMTADSPALAPLVASLDKLGLHLELLRLSPLPLGYLSGTEDAKPIHLDLLDSKHDRFFTGEALYKLLQVDASKKLLQDDASEKPPDAPVSEADAADEPSAPTIPNP